MRLSLLRGPRNVVLGQRSDASLRMRCSWAGEARSEGNKRPSAAEDAAPALNPASCTVQDLVLKHAYRYRVQQIGGLMGRLANSAPQPDDGGAIRAVTYGGGATSAVAGQGDTDKFTARLIKYVPAESLTVYLTVNTLIVGWYGLNQDGLSETKLDGTFYGAVWASFLIILAGTPYYLWRTREPGKPWKVNTVVTTIAFVAWAYSIGGAIFVSTGLFQPLIAALIAPLFTFLVPAFIRPEAVTVVTPNPAPAV